MYCYIKQEKSSHCCKFRSSFHASVKRLNRYMYWLSACQGSIIEGSWLSTQKLELSCLNGVGYYFYMYVWENDCTHISPSLGEFKFYWQNKITHRGTTPYRKKTILCKSDHQPLKALSSFVDMRPSLAVLFAMCTYGWHALFVCDHRIHVSIVKANNCDSSNHCLRYFLHEINDMKPILCRSMYA